MVDGDFLTVPVADVEPSWLENVYVPIVDQAIGESEGRVFRFCADSPEEADYLLARVRDRSAKLGRRVHEHSLGRDDPIVEWARLFGPMEGPVVTAAAHAGDVMLLSGGCRLPLWFVKSRRRPLSFFAKGAGVRIFLPLSRPVAARLPDDSDDRDLLVIPSLSTANRNRLRGLIDWMLRAECPTLRDDMGQDRSAMRKDLTNRFTDASPISRAQLREWIGYYESCVRSGRCRDIPSAVREMPPPVPGVGGEPPYLMSRESLKDRFIATVHRLNELNERFAQAMHRPLYRDWERPRDPFVSDDPIHWFEGLVSYLSCLLFDAGKNAVLIVTKFQVRQQPLDIIGEPISDLPKMLRTLRTFLQHGLNPADPADQKTILAAEAWFQQLVGISTPRRQHFRRLTQELLAQWEALLAALGPLVACVDACPSVSVLINELNRAERALPRIDLFRIVENVIRQLGVQESVDPEQFMHTYEENLRLELANSCVPASGFSKLAEELAERKIAELLATCPIRPQWLIERGIAGPDIGKLMRAFEEKWSKCHGMSVAAFINDAERRIAELVGKGGDTVAQT